MNEAALAQLDQDAIAACYPAAPHIVLNGLAELASTVNRSHAAARDAETAALPHAKAAGDALSAVKAALPHGQFVHWIEENCRFKRSTAEAYMTISKHWPAISQHAGNLSIRQALAQLKRRNCGRELVPHDERYRHQLDVLSQYFGTSKKDETLRAAVAHVFEALRKQRLDESTVETRQMMSCAR